jgi:hypothetical protein
LDDFGYSIRDPTRANRLESMTLELLADEGDGLRRTRVLQRWDRKKKNFVGVTVERDMTKRLKGKLVRDDDGNVIAEKYKPGELYEKWQKKNKHKEDAAQRPADAADDDEESAARKKNTRGGRAQRGDSDGRREPVRDDSIPPKRGESGKRELRSVDEIRRLRKQKEFNRMRNRKGGFAAAAKAMHAKPQNRRQR